MVELGVRVRVVLQERRRHGFVVGWLGVGWTATALVYNKYYNEGQRYICNVSITGLWIHNGIRGQVRIRPFSKGGGPIFLPQAPPD